MTSLLNLYAHSTDTMVKFLVQVHMPEKVKAEQIIDNSRYSRGSREVLYIYMYMRVHTLCQVKKPCGEKKIPLAKTYIWLWLVTNQRHCIVWTLQRSILPIITCLLCTHTKRNRQNHILIHPQTKYLMTENIFLLTCVGQYLNMYNKYTSIHE